MEEYINKALAGKTRSDKPFYCLSYGGPGSGKGLPASILRDQGHNNFVLIDKHIMDGYPEYEKIKDKHLHPEKTPDIVREYYNRATKLVSHAVKRGISIVFEDHGDGIRFYEKHAATAKNAGYETFLAESTCSIDNLRKLASVLSRNNGFPDMKDWRESYNRRSLDNSHTLKKIFGHGVLFEKTPDFNEQGNPGFKPIARFSSHNGKINEEIIDGERYTEYKKWGKIEITPEYKAYFARVDAAMAEKPVNDRKPGHAESLNGRRTERGFLTKILSSDKKTAQVVSLR